MALFSDWANAAAVDAADEFVLAVATTEEDEAPRAAVVAGVQRSSPVVSARATAADVRAVADARRGEKDTITVGTSCEVTLDTIHRSPLPSTLIA